MNASVQLEIKNAVWQVKRQPGRTVMRQVCLICEHPLKEWDVRKGKAVCWFCREHYWPTPKAPEKEETNNNVCPLWAMLNRKQPDLDDKVSYQPKGFHFTKMHYPRHYKPRTFYRPMEAKRHFMDTKIQYHRAHYVP